MTNTKSAHSCTKWRKDMTPPGGRLAGEVGRRVSEKGPLKRSYRNNRNHCALRRVFLGTIDRLDSHRSHYSFNPHNLPGRSSRVEPRSLAAEARLARFLGISIKSDKFRAIPMPMWRTFKSYSRNDLQNLTVFASWRLHIGGTTIANWPPSHLQAVWRKWSDWQRN
jgi:hypothetical protein